MEKILPNQVLKDNYLFIAYILRKETLKKRLENHLFDDLFQECILAILKKPKHFEGKDPKLQRFYLKLIIKRTVRLFLNKNYGTDCNERKLKAELVYAPDDNEVDFLDGCMEGVSTTVEDDIVMEQIKTIASKHLTGIEYTSVFTDGGDFNSKYRGLEKLKRYVS